jgi:hypothetical protein
MVSTGFLTIVKSKIVKVNQGLCVSLTQILHYSLRDQ